MHDAHDILLAHILRGYNIEGEQGSRRLIANGQQNKVRKLLRHQAVRFCYRVWLQSCQNQC